jgi:hypothetical protein
MGCRVQVLRESKMKLNDGETLCLQQVFYDHGEGAGDLAFRFIRRDAKGHMKAQRGQAAIPDLKMAGQLIEELNKTAMKISI